MMERVLGKTRLCEIIRQGFLVVGLFALAGVVLAGQVPTGVSAAMTWTAVTPNSGLPAGGQQIKITGTGFAGIGQAFTQVSGGLANAAAIDTLGNLFAWGSNYYGNMADGGTSTSASAYPSPIQLYSTVTHKLGNGSGAVDLGADTTIINVESGESWVGVIDSNGDVYAWGRNNDGHFGNGGPTTNPNPVKLYDHTTGRLGSQTGTSNYLLVNPAATMAKLSAGYDHQLLLDTDGNIYSWGVNRYGQMGNGTVSGGSSSYSASKIYNATIGKTANGTSIAAAGTKIVDIKAGALFSLALDADGNVYSWGSYSSGRLGTGATAHVGNPTRITALNSPKIVQIEAGDDFGIALDDQGSLYTWGNASNGRLGNGTTSSNVTTPVKLSLSFKAVDIAAGRASGAAITSSGDIYAWGDASNGRLGNGTTSGNVSTPIKTYDASTGNIVSGNQNLAPAGTKMAQIDSYNFNSGNPASMWALDERGTMYAWGNDYRSRNGDGGLTSAGSNSTVPKVLTPIVPPSSAITVTLDKNGTPANCAINSIKTTEITCTTSAHVAGTVDITINNAGTLLTLPAAYSYRPPMGITGITPRKGPIGGGTEITITGQSFAPDGGDAASVSVVLDPAGQAAVCNVKSVSDSAIVCTTTAHAAGAVAVKVENSAGSVVENPVVDAATGAASKGFLYHDFSLSLSTGGSPIAYTLNPAGQPDGYGYTVATVTTNNPTGYVVEMAAHGADLVCQSDGSLKIPALAADGALDIAAGNGGVWGYGVVPPTGTWSGAVPNPPNTWRKIPVAVPDEVANTSVASATSGDKYGLFFGTKVNFLQASCNAYTQQIEITAVPKV
jgi:alpha-tubulin suppressor-like RCC1 family protein